MANYVLVPGFWLGAWGEMLPNFDNRVSLDMSKVDAWGIPVLRIDCVHRDIELMRARQQIAALQALAELAGA